MEDEGEMGFNPEHMFADILDVDKTSMPPTPTHLFNMMPENMMYNQPPMPNYGMNMPDLASIEGELLKSAPPVSTVQQNDQTNFSINNLFNAYQEQQNMMPVMPPMMPQHLLNNHSPYMNIPYNPSSFPPPQTQQPFVDPYQQYQMARQQRKQEQQQLQQQQKQTPAQPTQPQKGKVKRAQNFVPPQIQKHHGKTITDLKSSKKKEEDDKNTKKKNVPKQKSPQANLTVQTNPQVPPPQQQFIPQHPYNLQQQQEFSPLQKWFGPNLGVDAVPQPQLPVQPQYAMPQNAMSLEEIEKQFR